MYACAGYSVGSLALVADSFHMLNDVMSLVVALYAVKLSQSGSEKRDPRYSYGWQRAEILGALINGVFLLALCFSIFMEALERLFNVSEVKNPRLVVVVGAMGLASNIVGLFLFHDHGHAHGGHSHSHGHAGEVADHAHNGHAHGHDHGQGNTSTASAANEAEGHERERTPSTSTTSTAIEEQTARRNRADSVESLYVHPAQTRAAVVRQAHDLGYDNGPSTSSSAANGDSERDRLLQRSPVKNKGYGTSSHDHGHDHAHDHEHDHEHDVESGDAKKKGGILGGFFKRNKDDGHSHGGHGHSHGHSHGGEGSMNMQGVFLHVLGDALGNVGVIASGLFIAFTSYSWRYYTDPAISFLITVIIFHSALPLVKSASFILLQGVPSSVPLEAVRSALLEVDGVLSVHELHIWQLSEQKNVASVHVLVDVDEAGLSTPSAPQEIGSEQSDNLGGEGGLAIPHEHKYMAIAAQIRGKLHAFSIHSSTIQPEFVRGGIRGAAKAHGVEIDESTSDQKGKLVTTKGDTVTSQLLNSETACLISCGPDGDCVEAACCPPVETSRRNSGSGIVKSSSASAKSR